MIATALAGVALVTPAHALQLPCEPIALQATRRGHVLAERLPWRAYDRGRLVAWWIPDSLTVRATTRVHVRWWCS